MEFVGEPRASGACNLLGVPGVSSLDVDDDEGEVVIGIRPKSSPLPRRRSSVPDEDSGPEPPLCGSRRVSFADAKGLTLVRVKEFDTWDLPKLPGYDSLEGEGKDAEEYYLSPLFFPLSSEELFIRVREQKVELETIELLPGTTILKGLIRVLNISFDKAVYVRTTLDAWSSHFDLLAEYIPGSSDGVTDCFSFKLTLVPPFGEQGARVDLCLRYETPVGTFWANNNNRNYVLFCHQRVKELKETPQRENVCRKSCLKAVSQNSPTVENGSSLETLPSQENVSTGASEHGEEVDSMKAQQISDSQSGPSEEDGQKLLIENSRNCSRRSRQRAARLARVRGYFAERDGKPNDKESDVSSQAAQGETPLETHSNVSETQSISEEHSKSGGFQFASEPLATTSKTSPDVQYETSPALDSTSNNKSEKSESYLTDSVTLKMGGKDATDIPNNPLHPNDEPAPTKHQNINKPVSKAEDNRQRQLESSREGMHDESTSNTAGESDGNVISAESIEGLVSQANSFIFGTVVAPLYHQVFGRVGSEGHNLADWGNPMRGRLNMGDSSTTQNDPHTERRETCSSVSADVSGNHPKLLGDTIKTQESDEECIDTALNHPIAKRRETSSSVSADASWSHAEILQDPAEIQESDQRCTDTPEDPKLLSEEETVHPRTLNVLSTDVLNARIPRESLHHQGKSQEDNLTHDLQHNYLVQKQTTAETAQAQPPEVACSQIKIQPDATLSQAQTQADTTSIQPSFLLPQLSQIVSVRVSAEMDQQIIGANDCACVDESNTDDDIGTTNVSTTNAYSEQDKPSEALQDLDPNCINEHSEIKDIVTKQEDVNPGATTEEHNWEIMVEEEEENILIDEERSEEINIKEEDLEAVEKDEGEVMEEQLEDTGIEKVEVEFEGMEEEEKMTEEEMEDKIAAAEEEEEEAEDTVGIDDKEMTEEEETEETVAGEEKDIVEKELEEDVEAMQKEKIVEQEIVVGEEEEEVETELEEEEDVVAMQEVDIQGADIQEEGEIEGEEEIEIDMNEDDETGVEWEDEVKPQEENMEEEISDDEAEMLVDEAVEAEIVFAEAEGIGEGTAIEEREDEVGGLEERSDVIQNKVEDDLSTPVNNVHEGVGERAIDTENTGEGKHACGPTEMHLYTEEDDQSNNDDRSKAERDENDSAAAEAGSCILTDEPGSDQTSDDNASTESLSDDEVELYMHCLKAVQGQRSLAQASRDRNKHIGFSVGKRPSTGRGKRLPSPMPSISESVDEEQHPSSLQDNQEDVETVDFQPTAAPRPAASGQESVNRKVAWWKETLSRSNISETLLYTTLLVVFLVVAYHYDFLACFGLYLISVFWLCCQGEKQPVRNNNRIG